MDTAEIEQRRTYYRDVVRQWSDNLYELDEHPTYRLLAAGEMAGKTGEQANQWIANAPQLWAWLGDLRDQLASVEKLVEERSVFKNTNADIALLLGERSISLPSSSLPKFLQSSVRAHMEPSPGDHRTMLISCDGLIELFRAVYEPIRDVVSRVDAVWRDIRPRIDAATVTLARARGVSDRLSVRLPEVALATQRLEAVRASVADDPLSLSARVGSDLDSLVSAAAEATGKLEGQYGSLDSDLEGTDAVLADLRVLRARAAAAYSEAEAKVIPADPLIRVPGTSVIDGQNGLAHRAAQIVGDATSGSREWQDARRDLDTWHRSATRLSEQLTKALDRNTSPIQQRNELRGRLQAYRVKADMSGGLSAKIANIGQVAHDELHTSPTDLGKAATLIDEFAARLASYGGQS